MNKIITFSLLYMFSGYSLAETINQPEIDSASGENIFAITQTIQAFSSEDDLLEYLKSDKPSTFRYYDRLDFQAKKQVFKRHTENQEKDITEIVLQVYRTSR